MFFGKLNYRKAIGNIEFTDEDGIHYKATNLNLLMQYVREHREMNGGDLSLGWKDRVGNLICEQNNYPFCFDKAKTIKRKLSLEDIYSFFSTIYKWKKKGFELVSDEEAEKRSQICVTCPNNTKIEGCTYCFGLINKVKSVIGNKKTSNDEKLEGCSVCACSLKAKVWLPNDVMQGSGHEFPSHCWLKNHKPK